MNQGRSTYGHESDHEGVILPVPDPETRRRRAKSDASQYPLPQGQILHSSRHRHAQSQAQAQRRHRIDPHSLTASHVPVESIPIPPVSKQQVVEQNYGAIPEDTEIHGVKNSQYSRCTGKKKALCVCFEFRVRMRWKADWCYIA